MLAVSTFVLTTLDTCTRLSRIMLQELTGIDAKTVSRRVLTTLIVLALPALSCSAKFRGRAGR